MISWLLHVFLVVTYSQSVDSTNGSEKLANHIFGARSIHVYGVVTVKMISKVLTKTLESFGM
jgi:hypothetical protein